MGMLSGLFSGERKLTPMEIAHHEFFTRGEKLDVLRDLKAEATGAKPNTDDVGYTAEEIDEAIQEVSRDDHESMHEIVSGRAAGR